ncbi:MAG: ferritin-like domain-containing protein [bacterium]|nr:ferritin-like domain-containing protein [bacterium]
MKQREPEARSLQARSSGQWHEHYVRNARSRLDVPWERGAEITPEEKEAIGESLQAWQLGETSDGRHLLAAARRYARRQDDPLFVEVVRLFIKEEQRHGRELGRFLDLAGIGRVSRNWGDTIFRAFRYCLPSMEIWVTVVVMVETLALLYYRAVRDATSSKVLRQICAQILRDEVHHIRFQYERLAILHRHRSWPLLAATRLVHRVLYSGIVLAVWAGHHRALSAGGYSFATYWQAAWLRMRFAWLRMDPVRYSWSESLVEAEPQAELATDR